MFGDRKKRERKTSEIFFMKNMPSAGVIDVVTKDGLIFYGHSLKEQPKDEEEDNKAGCDLGID